jgi:hypothetical protein
VDCVLQVNCTEAAIVQEPNTAAIDSALYCGYYQVGRQEAPHGILHNTPDPYHTQGGPKHTVCKAAAMLACSCWLSPVSSFQLLHIRVCPVLTNKGQHSSIYGSSHARLVGHGCMLPTGPL